MKAKFLFFIITAIFSSKIYAQNNRSQEPQEPFEYMTEDVTFKNKTDGISLAGTLTYPRKGTNFSAVILISGSGPQDRNSELMNHKPFLVIADYLTKNGIAVLRVDDRGVGKSEGNYNETGLNGFVNDTKSAVDFLKTREEINHSEIGLIGHSLGGVIAPIVASDKNTGISFIILLAGSGIRGDKLMLLQKEKIERKMGVPEIGITQGQKNMQGAYDIILKSDEDKTRLQEELKKYFTKIFGTVLPESNILSLSEQMSIPWLRDFIKFDPQISLSKTKCPVLAINGENDLQVPAKENLEKIEQILRENGNKNIETIQFENLNHLFQESKTGLPNEYAQIEQTFSPKVLEAMTQWIKKQTK